LADKGRLRQGDDLLQGGDAETFQPLDHEGIHREDGNGAGGKEGGELRIRYQDRLSRFGPGCRDPGAKLSRGPSHPGGRHQGPGENPKKCLEGDSHLPGRRAMKALQTVHPHEDSPPAGGLYHGAQFHEGFHHLLLGCVIVSRVRLQEGQGGTEGDGLGNHLSRTNACLSPSFRNLPEGSPDSLSRREERHGGGVQLRRANQLQPKLEGG
jgi:hypothetical protein